MARTLFTSDLHLGHANIIKHCDRPFRDIGEHDEALIRNWNAVVTPRDRVFVVGDFAHKIDPVRLRRIFDRLHGAEKHLVLGNHDHDQTKALPWTTISERAFVSVDDAYLVLDHYPGRTWHLAHKGSVQLYGHVHGRLPDLHNAADVGVDSWNYMPVAWQQIAARLADIPPRAEDNGEIIETYVTDPKPRTGT